MLGYIKIETTENYYMSSSEESKRVASEVMEKAIQSKAIADVVNYKYESK